MKKILFLILASVLCISMTFSMVSCTNTPADTTVAPEGSTAAPGTGTPDNSETAAPGVTTAAPATTAPAAPTTAAGEVSLVDDEIELFERFDNEGDHTPAIADYKELGCKFNVAEGCYLTGLVFESIPTWSTQDYSGFTVQLFKWDSDYDTTVTSEPLVSQEFTEWSDNAACDIDFFSIMDDGFIGFASGDYLWIFTGNTDKIGIWSMGPLDMCTYFDNGSECDIGYQVRAYILVPQ